MAAEHYNRGNTLLIQGKLSEAEQSYRHALALAPNDWQAWSNLGCTLWKLERLAEAESCLLRAVTLRPDFAGARKNLGGVLEGMGRLEEAGARYRELFLLDPKDPQPHRYLASVLFRLGRFQEAVAEYSCALKLKPDCADVWSDLGQVLPVLKEFVAAENCLKRAIEISPRHFIALSNLADVARIQGKFSQAMELYRRALSAEAGTSRAPQQVKMALAQEVILESRESAIARRAEVMRSIANLCEQRVQLSDPCREVGMTNFYFAYHGMNDVELQRTIANFYLTACPRLDWTAAHCAAPARSAGGRLRIGIVSSHLFNHTIGALYRGIIRKLSRERFEVVVIRPPRDEDAMSREIVSCADRAVEIPDDLYAARDRIAAERLDILFYPDLGMAPLTYYLAFARLAPVQCVSWGHPVTTGIPTIDYFISAKVIEPQDAQTHYSERLILLGRLPTYYCRPHNTAPPFTRAELGFAEDVTLYVCPQSLFKLHPDFDLVLATLLRRDPKARLLLITGIHRHWDWLLGARIAKGFPDIAERVVFVPRVPREEFFRLLTMADAVLDPPFFGGGNTSYEAFAMGLPIVTWPGPFMRGRVTEGCYRQMGFTELVADSLDSYIEIAQRLAHDRVWRERIKNEIAARSHVLYEDARAVTELEDFWCAAAEADRRGDRITQWGES